MKRCNCGWRPTWFARPLHNLFAFLERILARWAWRFDNARRVLIRRYGHRGIHELYEREMARDKYDLEIWDLRDVCLPSYRQAELRARYPDRTA